MLKLGEDLLENTYLDVKEDFISNSSLSLSDNDNDMLDINVNIDDIEEDLFLYGDDIEIDKSNNSNEENLYLSPEEKSKITEGKIVKRPFSWPFMATGVSAFAAYWKKDKALAKQTWDILFDELKKNAGTEGIMPMYYAGETEHDNCQEISWISTNTISQWCLNVIMGLEFIRKFLS